MRPLPSLCLLLLLPCVCRAAALPSPRPPPDPGQDIVSLAFSPDGTTLALCRWNGAVTLWDVRSGTLTRMLSRTLQGPGAGVLCVAFSPDGRRLAGGGAAGRVRVWDMRTGRLRLTLQSRATFPGSAVRVNVEGVAFWPDAKTLACDATDGVTLYDARTGRVLRTIVRRPSPQVGAAFSSSGIALVVGPGGLRLWDAKTGHDLPLHPDLLPAEELTTFALSPNGQTLAIGTGNCSDGDGPIRLRLWDVKADRRLQFLDTSGGVPYALAFSPDGKTLAGTLCGAGVVFWDVRTGRLRSTDHDVGDTPSVLRFSPDGRQLWVVMPDAVRPEEAVAVWDVSAAKRMGFFPGVRRSRRRGGP
jgi:WD40 repeat protein